MLKLFCALVAITLLSFSAPAQIIKGVLKDAADNTPLSGATLSLSQGSDSVARYSGLSAKDGSFIFNNIPSGDYTLTVSLVGYELITQPVSVKDSAIDAGTIALNNEAKVLGTVTVSGAAPPVKQKVDTLEYAASAFKTNPDANAEDVIKKMPGVTVDRSGAVTAQGENVRKVTVDGREYFGDDATAALRNLPSEVIDKIQVFDKLSDQAQFTGVDDGNTTKAINIVTKADMRNGQFGRVYAGYGTDSRYSAGGNVSFFNGTRRVSLIGLFNNINQQNFASQDLLGATSTQNRGGGGNRGGQQSGGSGNFRGGGNNSNFLVGQQSGISRTNAIGINFSDLWAKKMEVTGSYFYNNTNTPNNEITNREYFISEDSSQFYKENSVSGRINYNNRVNLRIEYKIDSFNTLIVTPNLSFQNNQSSESVTGINYLNNSDIISQTTNQITSSTKGNQLNNGILYRHAFNNRRRSVSLNVNTNFSNRDGENYVSAFNNYIKSGINDSLRQFSDISSNNNQYNFNLVYTEPLGKLSQLQFNYNPSFSRNDADQLVYQFNNSDAKYSLFDTSLSNKFTNNVNTQNGGLTYRVGNRDNQFSAGLSYQNSTLHSEQVFPQVTTINKNFNNVLANAMLRLKINTKSNIRIILRSSTIAPTVTQLQNVINNNNQLFLTTGNPELNQSNTKNFITRYSYTNTLKRTSFFANIFLQSTSDYITNATYIAANDSTLTNTITLYKGSQISKPVNLNGYLSARSFLTFGFPLKAIKSTMNWNAGFNYSKIPGLINNVSNTSNNYGYNLGAVLASNISEYIDFTLSYSANINQVKNTIRPQLNNNYFTQTAGFVSNFLTKSGWFMQNDISNQSYRGLTDGFNQSYWLWNAAIGKKFLKNQTGDLRLSVFDLLKQNANISRTITESYIQDVQSLVLQQYFMLTFSYKLKNYVKKK